MMKCEKLFCCWGGVPSFRSISRGKTNPSGLVANGNVANDNNTNVVFENIRVCIYLHNRFMTGIFCYPL